MISQQYLLNLLADHQQEGRLPRGKIRLEQTMPQVDAAWTCADLAKAVCDELVAQGLLKEKPAFIRCVLCGGTVPRRPLPKLCGDLQGSHRFCVVRCGVLSTLRIVATRS